MVGHSLMFVLVASTEATTRGNSCPEGQYECLSGLCISNTWVCDGTTDCPTYGDDELDCSQAKDSSNVLAKGGKCSCEVKTQQFQNNQLQITRTTECT